LQGPAQRQQRILLGTTRAHPRTTSQSDATTLKRGGAPGSATTTHLLGRSKAGSVLVLGVDWPRAARFGMFGLLGAPWAHYFYFYLDKLLPPTDKPFTRTTLVKVCIDQGIQAPALLALMISTISILKGTGLQGVRDDLSRNYWTSLLANWKLWLPFSFINLAFVKPTLRVLFVNAVFFGWTIILSMLINSSSI
jgi:Mpv17 / PMP22 family